MRICVDGVPLLLRSAGIKNYLHHWIGHLRAAAGDTISVFPWIGRLGVLHHDASAMGTAGTVARLALLHALNLPGNRLMDLLGREIEIFHACKLLNPPRRAKLTATIQDLTVWLSPHTHTAGVVKFERAFADRILRHADGLIAASESTRADAVRVLGLNPDKIHVIYHGISERYYDVQPDEAARARRKYHLDKTYILYIGTIEPRKNVDLLLDAYALLPASLRGETELILAGPRGWAEKSTLARVTAPPAGVRYLGYVPEEDLPGVLAGAAALAYPSLYEGFGFPPAQAFAAGAPVVTSNVSSLPEIAGDAAILIDPHSVESLSQGLRDVLLSPSLAARLREAGRARAAKFTWAECTRRSLEFFEAVAGR